MSEEKHKEMRDGIVAALKTVYDPEIPVDIYELGLIYEINIDDTDKVHAVMKITAEIYCTAGEFLCESVEDVARSLTQDFRLCPECTADEVIGSFLMEDSEREQHLTNIQAARGVPVDGSTSVHSR